MAEHAGPRGNRTHEGDGPGFGPGDDIEVGAIRGAGWSALEQWGGQAANLVAFLVLARLLAPTDFGLIAMAGVTIAVLQAAVEQSFSDAVVQRREVSPDLLDTAFWSTFGLASAAGLALAFAAGRVAVLFAEPALGPVVGVLAGTLPLAGLGATHLAILRRRLEFRPIAKRGLIASVVGGGVAVAVAVGGGGVWSLVAQSLITTATGTFLLWRATPWRPRLRFRMNRFRELGRFGGGLVAANLVNVANRYADDLIIGLVLGPVALGYYTVAYRLLWSGTRLLAGVISSVAFPALSRLQDHPERLRAAFYKGVRVAAVISFPMFVGLALIAPELVTVVFGEQWAPSAPVLRVLALIGLLHSVFYLNTSALMAAGRSGWVLRLNAVYAGLNVIAFLIAVRWGIVAVAAAYVLRGYLTAPLPLGVLRRVIGLDLRTYSRQLVGPAAAAAAMSLVLIGAHFLAGGVSPGAVFVGAPLLGAFIYVAALSAMDRESGRLLLRVARVVFHPSLRRTDDPGPLGERRSR